MDGKVLIIGQGYVGLPIAMAAVDAGYTVVGLENDPAGPIAWRRATPSSRTSAPRHCAPRSPPDAIRRASTTQTRATSTSP